MELVSFSVKQNSICLVDMDIYVEWLKKKKYFKPVKNSSTVINPTGHF